jgi:hypothetical protein
VVDGVVREGDLDESLVLGPVVADGESERLEQGPELFSGGIEKVCTEHR